MSVVEPSTHSSVVPLSLHKKDESTLLIAWSNSTTRSYNVRELRLACTCAMCRDEWTGKQTLDPQSISEEIRPVSITPVGLYALRFTWSDGHSSGIYAYETLQKLGTAL